MTRRFLKVFPFLKKKNSYSEIFRYILPDDHISFFFLSILFVTITDFFFFNKSIYFWNGAVYFRYKAEAGKFRRDRIAKQIWDDF